MNERIKLLAEQAGCKVIDDGDWYIPSATGLEKIVYTKGIGLEKFAELLAQEAADVAYNTYWNNPDKVRGAHLKQAIQQHFGVRS